MAVILAKATLAAGVRTLGPVSVPDTISTVTVQIDHDGGVLPGIAWGVMLSLDGGVTWRPFGAAGTHGPQTGPTSGLIVTLPPGANRLIQAFLWMSKATTLGVSVTVT